MSEQTDGGKLLELAAKLSTKQKEALLASEPGKWQSSKEIGVSGNTLRSLAWWWPKGSDPISPCICLYQRDYQDSPLQYIYRLTDRGVLMRDQVRAHTLPGDQ